MKNEKLETIEGFFRWASRHDMSISFSTEDDRFDPLRGEKVVVMRLNSRLRNYHSQRQFTRFDFEANLPFSSVLFSMLLEFEKAMYDDANKIASTPNESEV